MERCARQRCSLKCGNDSQRYAAASQVQSECGFEPKPSLLLSNEELVERLRVLLIDDRSKGEQKALLGMVEQPKQSLKQAFDLYWEYIKDEWMNLSHDQQRSKRNIYLRSIRNFESVVGSIDIQDLERKHAREFRSWWLQRMADKGLKPHTGN